MSDARPVGVFDSGIGGLTVLREIQQQFPGESCIYVADTLGAPYGNKDPSYIRERCQRLVAFLISHDVKAVVVACNTASVVALAQLRAGFSIPFVGIVPAVKPAAQLTRVGKIGVLATPATARSRPLAELIQQFTLGVIVLTEPCPGLAELIEAGVLDSPEVEACLRRCLAPMLAEGVDVIALGCTHYPLVREVMERICGSNVTLVDPAAAVARQLGRVLAAGEVGDRQERPGSTCFYTTGDVDGFRALVRQLAGPTDAEFLRVEI